MSMTIAEAAGAGARAIRLAAGVTLAEVAKTARFYGLPWTSGKVGDFESGRVSPTLPTLFAVAATLSDVCERPVSLAALFPGSNVIEVNDSVDVEESRLREALTGAAIQWEARDDLAMALDYVDDFHRLPAALRPVNVDIYRAVARDFSETDQRMAAAVGADRIAATAAMAKLWGRTYKAERDSRAGADANAQRKGRVARALKDELGAALHGDDK